MKVLAAIDHSSHSIGALEYLKGLRCRPLVELQLVEVIAPIPAYDVAGSGASLDIAGITQEQLEAAQIVMEEMSSSLGSDFRSVESHCLLGSPGPEIVQFVKAERVDLLLLGALGHSALSRVLLGSVSEYAAGLAPCSTLVVRPDGDNDPVSPPRRILVGIGNSANDEHLAEWVECFAEPTGTEVHLVHVMESMAFFRQDLLQRTSKYWKKAKSSAADYVDQIAATFNDLGYQTRCKVVESPHVGQALVDYANDRGCDLVVTGSRKENWLKHLILGSVSRHVLRHVRTPVFFKRGASRTKCG